MQRFLVAGASKGILKYCLVPVEGWSVVSELQLGQVAAEPRVSVELAGSSVDCVKIAQHVQSSTQRDYNFPSFCSLECEV